MCCECVYLLVFRLLYTKYFLIKMIRIKATAMYCSECHLKHSYRVRRFVCFFFFAKICVRYYFDSVIHFSLVGFITHTARLEKHHTIKTKNYTCFDDCENTQMLHIALLPNAPTSEKNWNSKISTTNAHLVCVCVCHLPFQKTNCFIQLHLFWI